MTRKEKKIVRLKAEIEHYEQELRYSDAAGRIIIKADIDARNVELARLQINQ